MEEKVISQITVPVSEANGNFLSRLSFFMKGFFYPCGSVKYYEIASEKKLIWAIGFFFSFAVVITSIATIQAGLALHKVGGEIKDAYERGEFPTIMIQDGIAKADGQQPFVFEDNRNILAIDTTGETKEIDTRSYSQGLLLTSTEIHLVNDEGYQVVLLSDLHEVFGNPIVVDKTQALELWGKASVWMVILAFVGILIWNSLIRFIYIVMLGLVVWGIVSIKRKGMDFSPILITGILANVPVIYLRFVLKLVNINFFGLYTILLVVIWAFALRAIFRALEAKEVNTSVDVLGV